MKTLDWSVETLGREYNSTGVCIHLYKTSVASETRVILDLVAVNEQTLYPCEKNMVKMLYRDFVLPSIAVISISIINVRSLNSTESIYIYLKNE